MPVVPQYQRQVTAAPLPAVRVPVSAPEGAFSPVDTAPATNIVLKAREDAEFKFDQMAVNTAERGLADARIRILQDPDAGVLNLKGINALQALPKAQEAWQKATSEIAGTLTSDRQKEAFQRIERGHYDRMTEQVAAHTSAELRKSDIDTTNSFLQDGLQTVNDTPEQAASVITDARKRLIAFGGRQGWTPEELKQKAAVHVSDIHAAAISSLIQRGDYDSAKQAETYLKANRGELLGKQRDDAEALVDAGLAEGGGLREADRILGLNQQSAVLPSEGQQQQEVGAQPKAPITMTDALTEAEKIKDPKQRKAATDAIVSHFAHIETAKRIDRQQTFDGIAQELETSGGRINKASPAWLKISEPEREQLLHRQEQLLYPKEHGDDEKYLELMNMATLPNGRAAFLAENIVSGYPQLSTSQRSHLLNLQREYGGKKAISNPVTAETLRFQRENALLKVGDPNSRSYIADKAERDTEVARIKRHFNELQAAHGLVAPAVAPPANATTATPTGPSGDVALPATPMLTPQKQATPAMLADVERKGDGYANYLRSLGYFVPPPAPAKPDPIPLPTTKPKSTSVTIKRDAQGRATTMIKEEH